MLGPIPAHAGEPRRRTSCTSRPRAYPRSRGGTLASTSVNAQSTGLSPLTRGNLWDSLHMDLPVGPIPAHAGEPYFIAGDVPPMTAYPRSRGGTLKCQLEGPPLVGLSPLTRGNLRKLPPLFSPTGPIPAHAGEPQGDVFDVIGDRAYPRSRGGTQSDSGGRQGQKGLSPLTRGNLCGRCNSCV